MSTKTKTINAGPVGLKPKGAYNASATYTVLDTVLYNHDSWVCKALDAEGKAKEITGIAPDDPTYGAVNWQSLTDGGIAAYNEGNTAQQKGNTAEQQGNEAESKGNTAAQKATLANEKAALADEKAAYAQSQGDYALQQAQRAETVADQVVEEVIEALIVASVAESEASANELT